jgi:hypothetical protein
LRVLIGKCTCSVGEAKSSSQNIQRTHAITMLVMSTIHVGPALLSIPSTDHTNFFYLVMILLETQSPGLPPDLSCKHAQIQYHGAHGKKVVQGAHGTNLRSRPKTWSTMKKIFYYEYFLLSIIIIQRIIIINIYVEITVLIR